MFFLVQIDGVHSQNDFKQDVLQQAVLRSGTKMAYFRSCVYSTLNLLIVIQEEKLFGIFCESYELRGDDN